MQSELVEAVILGIVQGITEFFPVSSTAHLILFPWLFNWSGDVNTLMFDVGLHGGTLMALLLCFYRDWMQMLTRDRRKFITIAVATIPAGVCGALFHDQVEHALRSPLIIAASTMVFGIVMLIAERYSRQDKDNPSFMDAMVIGVAQAVALIPGVSRSGITITTGLFRNLTRETAARFSFLLSTPVIGGATLLEGRKLLKSQDAHHLDIFLVGFLAAFVSGFFAIKFLLHYLRNHPLTLFAYYRFFLAAIIAIVWITRNPG